MGLQSANKKFFFFLLPLCFLGCLSCFFKKWCHRKRSQISLPASRESATGHYSERRSSIPYRMRINYRRILQNHIFTDTEQKYMMLLPLERHTTSKDTTRIARAHQHRKRERHTRHAWEGFGGNGSIAWTSAMSHVGRTSNAFNPYCTNVENRVSS